MNRLIFLFGIIFSFSLGDAFHAVIFDVGSSGTRVFVLKWEKITSKLIPVDSNYSLSVKPGISPLTVGVSQEQMDEYFKPLILYARSKVPKEDHHKTPLYLMATGGLRLLSHDSAQKILERVHKVLIQSNFMYDKEKSVKIISGIEEGLFGWISINFIHNNIGTNDTTFGVLDLGGASTQISFVPENPDSYPRALVSLQTGNFTHRIYIRSFLGFGINEARRRFETDLTVSSENSLTVMNPCLPKGYKRIGINFNSFMFGASNFTGCLFYSNALLKKEKCISINCSIAGIFQPFLPNKRWYARDHYARVVRFLGLQENPTIAEIEEAAKTICALNYKEYIEKYSKEPEHYCFEASYIVALLKNGYGFDLQSNNIHFTDQVNGLETSWTLGALLFLLANFSYSMYVEDETLVDSTISIGVVTFFLFVIGLVVLSKAWLPHPRSRSFSKKAK